MNLVSNPPVSAIPDPFKLRPRITPTWNSRVHWKSD